MKRRISNNWFEKFAFKCSYGKMRDENRKQDSHKNSRNEISPVSIGKTSKKFKFQIYNHLKGTKNENIS